MTLTDNFSLRSWLVALRYSVEYYDDICESATASRTGGRTTMSIGEKGKIESGGDDGLYANVWECRGDSPARKLKTSLESVENSIYEENASLYESARSSCGSLTNTRNDNDKISDLTDLDDLQSGDSNNPSPIYENIPIYDDVAKEENIYENLPRALDDREFEEEIYSTIKCLDNVLDSVVSSSDDEDDYASNLTEDFCERDNSSVNFELGDYCEIRSVRDEKFTESSSSFGEFLREDQIRTNKDQRFALYEEPEPISPQEIKNIPVPKRNPISVRPWQRFSFPTKTEKESAARPQSFPVFRQNSPEKVARSTYNIEDDEHFARNKRHEEDFEDCVSSLSGKDDLNLSFAREHRVSVIFDEKVEELDGLEVKESTIFGNDLILRLKENAITWMALLTEDVCDEMEIIMEDKEILKTVKDVPKGLNVPLDNKFPVDDEIVQTRRNTSRHTRNVKTTDYDSRKKVSDANNFEIRGVIKLKGTSEKSTYIIKPKDEYILYENENLYRVNPTKKEMLKHGVVIRSARHLNTKSKEPVEVELKDKDGGTYTLTFASPKYAKQFIDSDRLPIYVPDQNRGIADKLLKLLGKRSSREILERKGIYKNEPIFGNTLKEIYHKSQNPVPPFICKIVELIEKPENIKSMGLYRTSGNLATIQKIRLAADNGRLDILDNFSKDPDVLTGSLKLFFRELKEPLMPYCIFNQMADIIKIPLNQLTTKDHQKIRSIIVKYMYESNLATFRVIMRHLVEVVKHKEDNKMDAYNLAICWGPSLIFPNVTIGPESTIESTKDLVSLSHDATRLTDFLIGYYQMYPAELGGRPESFNEKTLSSLKRQESRDSIESADSSTKSYKKSNSNLSLSVDEVMKRAIEYIEMNLNAEGLYSRSGTPDKTNKILKKLSKKKSTELDKYRNEVHDMCNALMIYIKELPEPLVDYNTVETLAKIYSNSQNHLEANLRRDVMVIIEKTARKDSLIFLLRHLAKVFNNQPLHKVSKSEMIIIWTKVLNHGFRVTENNEQFAKFLTVAVEVFNDNLPDLVKSSFNNNGSSHNRNENMAELLKDLRQHQERDRNSRYDNIDCEEIDEATLLDQKTEQTKL